MCFITISGMLYFIFRLLSRHHVFTICFARRVETRLTAVSSRVQHLHDHPSFVVAGALKRHETREVNMNFQDIDVDNTLTTKTENNIYNEFSLMRHDGDDCDDDLMVAGWAGFSTSVPHDSPDIPPWTASASISFKSPACEVKAQFEDFQLLWLCSPQTRSGRNEVHSTSFRSKSFSLPANQPQSETCFSMLRRMSCPSFNAS